MDSIATSIASAFEFPIDFEGQKSAHAQVSRCLSVGVVASILAGVLTNNIFSLLLTFIASLVITAIIVVPSWPAYNKNPVSFLKVKYDL